MSSSRFSSGRSSSHETDSRQFKSEYESQKNMDLNLGPTKHCTGPQCTALGPKPLEMTALDSK